MATDIIVRLPRRVRTTEFMRTMDLLEEIKFDKVRLAAYSPRPGTVAAGWPTLCRTVMRRYGCTL